MLCNELIMRNGKAVAAMLALVVAIVMLAGPALAAAPMGKTFGALGGERISFETVDTDGNGLVTQAELDALRDTKFAALDSNGDGSLTQEEFSERATRRAVARARRRSEKVFQRLDSDGDGLVSFDKFKAAQDSRRDSGKGMIARLDTNGDGAVSEAEFDVGKERQARLRKKAGGKLKGVLKKPFLGRFGF